MLASSTVQAQVLSMPVFCMPLSELTKLIQQFEEEGMLSGVTTREDEKGKETLSPVVIFMNPQTKSWTIVEKVSSDRYCVLAAGGNLKPIIEKENKL